MASSEYTTKQCTGCNQELPATSDYFYADKRAKDGFYPCCKVCFLERCKKSRYKDIEKTNARELASYYRHHKERLEGGRRYREANREKEQRRHAKYYRENKKKIQQYQQDNLHIWRRNTQRWKEKNPERARMLDRIRAHNRRVKIRANSDGTITPESIEQQRLAQGNNCWWCGKPIRGKFEIDHRIPIAKGGEHTLGNIVIVHGKCNRHKSAKLPWEYNGRLL